jgi:hypothetical protein
MVVLAGALDDAEADHRPRRSALAVDRVPIHLPITP